MFDGTVQKRIAFGQVRHDIKSEYPELAFSGRQTALRKVQVAGIDAFTHHYEIFPREAINGQLQPLLRHAEEERREDA